MYQIGYKFENDENVTIINGFDCGARFLDELNQYSKTNNCVITLISFNGSRFDDILLMRYIMNQRFWWLSGVFKNNSLLGLKVGGWLKCWDLNRFLCGSLKGNC